MSTTVFKQVCEQHEPHGPSARDGWGLVWINAALRNDVATHSARAHDATQRVDHLEADLAGARLSLRRMARDTNTGSAQDANA